MLDNRPYFFKYVYEDTKKEYKDYLDKYTIICKQKYRMDFHELESLPRKTTEQQKFIDNFYEFCPVIISNSPMNLLCRYIEGINFDIAQKTKIDASHFDYSIYKNDEYEYEDYYEQVKDVIKKFLDERKFAIITMDTDENDEVEYSTFEKEITFDFSGEELFKRLEAVNRNPYVILNCLVDYFYKERPKSNKDILWNAYGRYIYKNIKKNSDAQTAFFPMPCNDNEKSDLEYLGYNYKLQEVQI